MSLLSFSQCFTHERVYILNPKKSQISNGQTTLATSNIGALTYEPNTSSVYKKENFSW